MDLLYNVIMDIFKKFPSIIVIEKNISCKKINKKTPLIKYAKKLAKFRNYFKDYFVDTNSVTIKGTTKYLTNIKDNKKKIMYLVYYKKKIIGQYGVHQWDKGYIGLDGAMRISKEGTKNLFYDIQKIILYLLKKNIPTCSPVIICHKKNLTALKLHKKFKFKKINDKTKLKFFENYIISKKNKVSEFYIKEYII